MHENSALHKKYYHQWFEREIRLKRGNTIDCEEQKLISRETLRWNNVLTRLMNIVLYLAENNMAFRGSSDKLYTPNNGKFLGLVQLLGKFDPVMEEHLKLATTGGISDHYCVNRWKILSDHVELYSLKKLSDTRWEAKINSVKSVRYQICEIHDALVTLANLTEKTDHTTSHEASTLAEQLKDFSFIVSLVVCYEILFQINVVSKPLQSKDIDLGKSAEMLGNCCNFFEEYRKTGFKKALCTASDLAKALQTKPEFAPAKRLRRIRRQDGEMATDEPIESPEKKFEVEFFNKLLDIGLMSLKERFQQLKDYSQTWSFLHDIKIIPEKNQLAVLCANLQQKLSVGSNSDIDGGALCDELISLQPFLPDENISCINVLNFIRQRNIQELYPNVWIAFRIFATIPVTVASGERSFSKLKLIKTYLRSTTSQSRLSNLATLSIENEIAEQLDFSSLIRVFADKKARKVKFY
ncbi:uncharacterized protein LOC124295433 [Neodiprion lecontei]|uniref:Uncharacterized protein LOC124295433 n=1 Tax=Neodiprion lecontei TaxID=441921 RepID=A0ABM3GM81_NEOLC|nr:uncharacterized protein LOC124295433 [Neodiprion lecontei]